MITIETMTSKQISGMGEGPTPSEITGNFPQYELTFCQMYMYLIG